MSHRTYLDKYWAIASKTVLSLFFKGGVLSYVGYHLSSLLHAGYIIQRLPSDSKYDTFLNVSDFSLS